MRKYLFSVLALICFCGSAVAQQASAPSQTPSRQDILKLMDVLHARQQFEQIIGDMTRQLKSGARQAYQKEHPDTTEARLKRLDAVFDEMPPAMTVDDLLDDVVPIYQRYLTKQDIAAVIMFYNSDSGKRFFTALPKIQEEGIRASDARTDERVSAYVQRLAERMRQFEAEEIK